MFIFYGILKRKSILEPCLIFLYNKKLVSDFLLTKAISLD